MGSTSWSISSSDADELELKNSLSIAVKCTIVSKQSFNEWKSTGKSIKCTTTRHIGALNPLLELHNNFSQQIKYRLFYLLAIKEQTILPN
jgi:hypothetical protein